MSAAQPIFVDDSGRRRALTRRVGRIALAGIAAYLGLLVLGLAHDPRLGPIPLPTFGVPSLDLTSPPAAAVLGAQESRTGAGESTGSERSDEAQAEQASGTRPTSTTEPRRSTPTSGPTATAGPATSGPGAGLLAAPGASKGPPAQGVPMTPATTSKPGQGPRSTTTTTTAAPSGSSTTTSSTTTTTTTTTTPPGSGQGQGRSSGASSGKGPDGSGAPGQTRKTTTTMTAG